jgi:hypothetical protein
MRKLLLPMVLSLSACASDGGTTPQGAVVYDTYLRAALLGLVSSGPGARLGAQTFLVPSAAAAQGIQVAPDTSPGAPPNSWTFTIPLDTDGDPFIEAVATGTVQLNGDLFTFGPGFGGTVAATVDIFGGEKTLLVNAEFEALAEGFQVSGTASLTDTLTGITTGLTISGSSPLAVKLATGDPGAQPNVCLGSASGEADVESHGPGGDSYSAHWTFSFNSRNIQVSDAHYTDPVGMETPISDSSFALPCDTNSISQWAGTYDFHWFCNPQEEDTSTLVITVTGPNRIHVVDGSLEYDATAVPGHPEVMRGFFFDNGYREDFDWTLAPDGLSFTQSSTYVFQPPLTGGGVCGGVGLKQ